MALYVCTKRHFVAGGQLVEVGTVAEFKADPGALWQQKEPEPQSERKLEVATPKKRAATKEQ